MYEVAGSSVRSCGSGTGRAPICLPRRVTWGSMSTATSTALARSASLSSATRRLTSFTSASRSEEHTSELQSPCNLVCRLLLEKKNTSQPESHLTPYHHLLTARTQI